MGDSSTKITRNRIIMALVALFIIIVAFALFLQANQHRIEDQNADYLAGSTQQTARRIDDLLTNASTNPRHYLRTLRSRLLPEKAYRSSDRKSVV